MRDMFIRPKNEDSVPYDVPDNIEPFFESILSKIMEMNLDPYIVYDMCKSDFNSDQDIYDYYKGLDQYSSHQLYKIYDIFGHLSSDAMIPFILNKVKIDDIIKLHKFIEDKYEYLIEYIKLDIYLIYVNNSGIPIDKYIDFISSCGIITGDLLIGNIRFYIHNYNENNHGALKDIIQKIVESGVSLITTSDYHSYASLYRDETGFDMDCYVEPPAEN